VLNNIQLGTVYENNDYEKMMEPLHHALATLLKTREIFNPIVEGIFAAVK
jgi:hypothetical protein